MGVYIKGMDMPLACSNCAFCEESYFYAGAYCRISEDDDMMSINEIRSKRRDNCPLISVPPHGRLIDGDKLAEEQKENVGAYHANLITLDDLAECLLKQSISEDGAPTIIPAEEGET